MRLALIVNGLYFISLFTPTTRPARPHLFTHSREMRAEQQTQFALPPDYVPLPPPSAPRRAFAYESGGRIHVSLNDDLILIKKPGHMLTLSPSFSARTQPQEEPGGALLRFTLFSNQDNYPDDCQLSITADGARVWPELVRDGRSWPTTDWTRESVPHSSTKLPDGQMMETMAAESLSMELPYELFLKMISAKQVRIILGPDKVELTADQIDALRDMHRRLPQPPLPDDTTSN
ncbi:MAG: hypothetical protein ACJ74T_17390 [Pyrinomonadaceae bacterium]